MDTSTLREKIVERVEEKNRLLAALRYPQTIEPDPIFESYSRFAERIRTYVTDTTVLMNKLVRDGKSILFEGAQATLLDIDHGTYPYVTSSSAAAGGAATGLGLSPKHVHTVMGVTKAYTTRVGGGPFPTECHDTAGDNLRTRGSEYGATTGRPRRCGWFDGPALRYAALVNDPDSIAVTKIDVLDSFEEIPFCTGYKYRGSPLNEFPAEIDILSKVEPVYKVMPGWKKSIAGVRDWVNLPAATQDYLKFLADYLGVPIRMVSTGADREDTVHLS
jgi:adenylosuccinate synthase